MAKLFCKWSSLWLRHKILKRNPGLQKAWCKRDMFTVGASVCTEGIMFCPLSHQCNNLYTACSLIMNNTDASINTKKLWGLCRLNGISIRARAMIMHSEGSYHSSAEHTILVKHCQFKGITVVLWPCKGVDKLLFEK